VPSPNDYTVLTLDLDFSAILAATQGRKPSVVQLRSDERSFRSSVFVLPWR